MHLPASCCKPPTSNCTCSLHTGWEHCPCLQPRQALCLIGPGSVVEVRVRLRAVCPGKRVGLAVILTETDDCGCVLQRSTQILTVPAQSGTACRDLVLPCIPFVMPSDRRCTCGRRQFQVQTLANYLDTDLQDCEILPETAVKLEN